MKTTKNKCVAIILAVMLTVSATAQLPDFTTLAEQHTDAIVSVQARSEAKAGEQQPKQPRGFFFQIPPNLFKKPRRTASQGSGFIIDEEGYVLTNAHVIEGMDIISIVLKNGEDYEAEIIGVDKHTDIALLKIEGDTPFAKVAIGDSDNIKVGQWVAAVGSPYGLDQSVTAGIISALRRQLPNDRYVPFIQTDAAVNPGNSGGPLMDLEGNVIGINSQIISPVQAYVGASFAIPINVAMEVQALLRVDGEVQRGWLGVSFGALSKDVAEAYGLAGKEGVLITDVVPGSPAEEAELQGGDVILKINGEDMSAEILPRKIGVLGPGEEVTLHIWRDGEGIDIVATLGSWDNQEKTFLGMKVQELSSELKRQTGLEFGVVISEIGADVPRDVRQLRTGDVITHMLVNERRREIKNGDDLESALLENEKSVEVFYIWRQGRRLAIAVKK
ncbi:MAG: Do family serine endopeptidase [Gammaproteobacteria bacterium WSBS_2016_MAG_OTU1]